MNIKILTHLIFSSLLVTATATTAKADSQHLFSGGFNSASGLNWTYSVSDSYANTYIVPAANSWNNISSKVKLNKVTSGTYNIRATLETTTVSGRLGLMTPYCRIGGVNSSGGACLSYAWGSAKVTAYSNQMSAFGMNTSNIISNYAHEFGHALSLAHVSGSPSTSPISVMKQGIQSYLPQQTDKDHLKQKWGI